MEPSITVQSPAKINLHLEIGALLPGGLHQLRSLFQLIDLEDTMTITRIPSSKEFSLSCRGYLLPKENTIQRAYAAFTDEIGESLGCSVEVVKQIPPGSGLGGGSSNAAALLYGLNRLTGFLLSAERLLEIGSTIGSDVPFFLCGSPCAFVEGTGNVITGIHSVQSYPMIIAMPELHISTPWAYRQLDSLRRNPEDYQYRLTKDECIKQICYDAPSSWKFFNSFQPLLERAYPAYRKIRQVFEAHHVPYTVMSGSGAAFLGICMETSQIRTSITEFKRLRYWVKHVKMLAKSPFAVYNDT